MFAVRSYYRRHGLRVVDWARRPDDHLVTQLEFLAYLLEGGEGDVAKEAAAFLDEHLRRWIGRFSRRVAQQCRTSFYAALALLTSAYVEELRSVLSALLSAPQPSRDELETLLAGGASADLPMPINGASVGPGW
jgi:TorA maturation chaperone TorD